MQISQHNVRSMIDLAYACCGHMFMLCTNGAYRTGWRFCVAQGTATAYLDHGSSTEGVYGTRHSADARNLLLRTPQMPDRQKSGEDMTHKSNPDVASRT
jgi:hypothetical protein